MSKVNYNTTNLDCAKRLLKEHTTNTVVYNVPFPRTFDYFATLLFSMCAMHRFSPKNYFLTHLVKGTKLLLEHDVCITLYLIKDLFSYPFFIVK